jgi:myo-inositol 2-dehydrogenase/D-chiro-inositol 1-dehydrogenase
MNYHRRYHGNFERMKNRVENGDIGEVEMINLVARDPSEPHWDYLQWSGGLFKDMSVHDLDMARYIAKSPIKSIFANGANLFSENIKKAND